MDEFKDILEYKNLNYYWQRYKKIFLTSIIIMLLILIILFITIFKVNKKEINNNEVVLTENKEIKKPKKEKAETIKVDIKGEVLNPSVYELNVNARIIDVINKAGGLNADADTSYINLSKKLKDEMVIIIYSKKEVEEYKKQKDEPKYVYIEKDCECPDEMNDACIQKKSETKNAKDNTSSEDQKSFISLNDATLEELQTLSGIGKSKAENIISYRKENGSFKTIDDLKNVSGIGDSIFEKIKDQITV